MRAINHPCSNFNGGLAELPLQQPTGRQLIKLYLYYDIILWTHSNTHCWHVSNDGVITRPRSVWLALWSQNVRPRTSIPILLQLSRHQKIRIPWVAIINNSNCIWPQPVGLNRSFLRLHTCGLWYVFAEIFTEKIPRDVKSALYDHCKTKQNNTVCIFF